MKIEIENDFTPVEPDPQYILQVNALKKYFPIKGGFFSRTVGYVKASIEKDWNLVETDWDAVMLPVKHAWSLCAGVGNAQTFAPGGGDILKEILLNKKDWIDAQGRKVDENKLPDWEKLPPPGGMIADDKAKDNKLDWEKLRDYLGH